MNMPDTRMRPFHILDILSEKTDAEHRITVPELVLELSARGVAAERKAVYRDIAALKEYGHDIVYEKRGYYLRARRFELAELRLLTSAVQASKFITQPRAEALMEKLSGFLSAHQREALLAQSNLAGIRCRNDEVYNAIEAINMAIAAQEKVSFMYFKRDLNLRNVIQRSGLRYLVSPYAMIWVQDKYYLVCNMQERDNLTHFRLDRMLDVRVERQSARACGEVSEYAGGFDAADYSAKCLNMFGGEVQRVSLRCENSLLGEVLDRFGEEIYLQRGGENSFTVRVQVAVSEGFLSWASQFGERLIVLSPDDVRQAMRRRLAAALARYNTDD